MGKLLVIVAFAPLGLMMQVFGQNEEALAPYTLTMTMYSATVTLVLINIVPCPC